MGMQAKIAIGPRDGDYLKLENQWGRIAITRENNGNGMPEFVLTGDLKDYRDHRRVFTTVTGALEYAMQSLAQLQLGAFR